MPEGRRLGFQRHEPATDADPTTMGAEPGPGALPTLDDRAAAALLPARPARAHKGTFGKVLVIAGSLDYAGAALLVCRSAGRAGAGLVTLAIPESLQPLFAAKVVEATTMALPEDDVEEVDPEPALARILDHDHDALVLGPGLRPGLATAELVRELLHAPGEPTGESAVEPTGESAEPRSDGRSGGQGHNPPIVLDAEALRSMATLGAWWEGATRPCVLTPHPGEFARLREGAGIEAGADGDLAGDDAARAAAALDAARSWGQVVILKGARTVIAEPDGSGAVLPFENPALATGGTGDVLAGIVGALLAQGLAPGAAARLGAYLHGLAGEAVRERIGDAGLLASDLPDAIPMVRKRLAAIADRDRSGKRLGFGVREPDGATA
ncbi:MAG TPA: ADP/ATP-dependent (S)-NAD(P)H-hydrate dehydratase [Candidatus Limnocylindrales bacterium]